MLFSSLIFLFYFLPLVLLLYYICRFSRTVQNMILLMASLLFYAWGEPGNIILLLGSVVINYIFGMLVHHWREQPNKAKVSMFLCVVINLFILFIFKYLNFVVENVNALFGEKLIVIKEIALPIGISFFTFQAISYVVDVYRNQAGVEKNPFYVGLYIAFFPQLIAGPIVRYNSIAEQIRHRRTTINQFCVGTARFAMGFVKKVLLANNLAVVADRIFKLSAENITPVPITLAWLGAIAYTLQIFYDFSAYSDMAIGLGLMFGFKFEENFNYPYISRSVGEFWRRWHISLSTWFREYVYFPLGGSRVRNQDIMVRNLFVVWVLTGVWHGANWTFFLWGFANFLFILLERFIRFEEKSIPDRLKHIYLLLAIIFGWVLFRADNLGAAGWYMANMLGLSGAGFFSDTAWMFVKEYFVFFFFGILFAGPVAREITTYVVTGKMKRWGYVFHILYPVTLLLLVVISVSYLVKGSYNPFIYFNF